MSDRFLRQRQDLIKLLRDKGIEHEGVLAAIAAVPRHAFVDDALVRRAYEDEALPIGRGQTISQPFTVAHQSALLNALPDERILEIGTGSGYQAAVLCEMQAQVFTIERQRPLYDRTRPLLRELGYRANCRFGDGMKGWSSMAPYDGIIVTAGARSVPEALLDQLRLPEGDAPGGRLIIPIGGRSGQTMYRITRMGESDYRREETAGFRFVPLLGNTSG